MSETPRDQRELWHEVSRTFEELGEALRVHLSPDAARSPSDPTTPRPSAGSGSPGRPGEGAGAGASDSDWIGSADAGYTEPAPWADPARPGESEGFAAPALKVAVGLSVKPAAAHLKESSSPPT